MLRCRECVSFIIITLGTVATYAFRQGSFALSSAFVAARAKVLISKPVGFGRDMLTDVGPRLLSFSKLSSDHR